MSTVLILKGLPASGKTTYAKELVDKGQSGSTGAWKRVNKDDLREMMDNSKWSKKNEDLVIMIRDAIIVEALMKGFNVVVDDTNLHPKHEAEIREYVERYNDVAKRRDLQAKVEVKFFDITVQEAIKRDLKRPKSVGEKVIKQMYNQFLTPPTEKYVPPENKPRAIICDIDGTLAHMADRSPYDYSKVKEDVVDETIKQMIDEYPYHVILVSGRPDSCFADTFEWLKDNGVTASSLFMRKSGDTRNDTIVKEEIFNEHIRNEYQIDYVLDDRDRVVEKWRSMGLKVLQVAPGDF